jgi:hypothetical protein
MIIIYRSYRSRYSCTPRGTLWYRGTHFGNRRSAPPSRVARRAPVVSYGRARFARVGTKIIIITSSPRSPFTALTSFIVYKDNDSVCGYDRAPDPLTAAGAFAHGTL